MTSGIIETISLSIMKHRILCHLKKQNIEILSQRAMRTLEVS
jgi:hypothetical protein